MPRPYEHRVNKVTIYGSSYSGAEIWSTGFYLGAVGSDAPLPSESTAAAIKSAWTPFFTSSTTTVSYTFKTLGVKVAPILQNGSTDMDHVVNSPYATAIEGQSGSSGFPPQCSLVATLLADNGRGLAGKGRMYLPGIAIGIGANGHLTSGANTAVANLLKTMFDSIEASFDGGQLINASHGRAPFEGSTAVNRSVTHIRVGDVYDTQRRRRNALVEQYATAALAT